MALTADIHPIRYGAPGNSTQPTNLPLTASATVYRGSVATTRSGYLVAASSPQSTDVVWGLIDQAGPGNIDGAPGIIGGTTNGAVTVDVATGTFWLSAGTGSDAITVAQLGQEVYLIDEKTVGATSGGGTRPVAGVLIKASDLASYLTGLVAVKLGTNQSSGGPS